MVHYFPCVFSALISEEFLQTTASQLTYHGLSEIAGTVAENQLCVFFRNNHFSTLYKHKVRAYILRSISTLISWMNGVLGDDFAM